MNPTIKQLDQLWAECIKARAEYLSEISQRPGRQVAGEHILNAHHIVGKPNYRLRFELDNGICITGGEHKFDAHGSHTRKHDFEYKVRMLRGQDVYEELLKLRHQTGADLNAIKLFLETELKKYSDCKC